LHSDQVQANGLMRLWVRSCRIKSGLEVNWKVISSRLQGGQRASHRECIANVFVSYTHGRVMRLKTRAALPALR